MVMKTHQARTPPPSRVMPVLKWLHARFREYILPLLRRSFAWARAKWDEIAARSRRD